MILIVSKHLGRLSSWELIKELVRRFATWCLREIEVRAAVVVANVRLNSYMAGVPLEEMLTCSGRPSRH